MIRVGERPSATDLTNPLAGLATFLEANEANVGRAKDLLSTITRIATEPDIESSAHIAADGLLALGGSYLLPLSSGSTIAPSDFELETNGVLGNHLEVRYSSGSYGFIGGGWRIQDLADEDLSSGIQVEAYQIDAETMRQTRGYGFTSAEGVSWLLPNDQPLRCRLSLLVKPGSYQYLFLQAPDHLPPPFIERISTDDNVRYAGLTLRGSVVLPLTGNYSRVVVELLQPYGYVTTIGHSYLYEVLTPTGEVYGRDDIRRVPGPYPSLAAYGAVQASDRSVHWAKASEQPNATGQRGTDPVEVIRATRYTIGLTETSLLSGSFVSEGSAVIGPFSWVDTPSRVRVDANVMVPSDWPAGDWVQMWISGNGRDWSPISPDGLAHPRSYVIGRIPVQEESPVIASEDGRFWLRLKLSRPDSATSQSPVVSNPVLVGED